MSRDLQKIRGEATEAIDRFQKYATNRAQMRFKPAKKYKKGEYVVILNVDTTVGPNRKIIPKYRGPYVIYKELGHDRYVIRDIDNCQLTQLPYDGVVEASRIHKWLSPLGPSEIDCMVEESDAEESDIEYNNDGPGSRGGRESEEEEALSDDEEDFHGF